MNPVYPEVAARAGHRCEYCRAPEAFFNFPFEVEHVVPSSRQGTDDAGNLALACRSCNLHKGNVLMGIDENSGEEVSLFNPRLDSWSEHFEFQIEEGIMVGRTPRGRATIARLKINRSSQVQARVLWAGFGFSP